MDINIPLMNGLKQRKTASKGIVTPVIALTAFDKEIEEALSAGIDMNYQAF
jgi:DNA-binding response OmpR family regulator